MQIPAPFHYSLDMFLRGLNSNRVLEVSQSFAKPFSEILHEHEFRPSAESIADATPSEVSSDFYYVRCETGLWLLDKNSTPIGCYDGSMLALAEPYQGQGLGRELVIRRCLIDRENPVWYLDESAYSPAGYATHRSAWFSFRKEHAL